MAIFLHLFVIGVSLLFTLFFTYSWLKYTKYQFLECDRKVVETHQEYSIKWHNAKGLNQIIFFTLILMLFGLRIMTFDIIVYWILFDGFSNKKVLNKPFNYVGTTAKTDILLQKVSKLFNISVSTTSIGLKLLLLVISIILLF